MVELVAIVGQVGTTEYLAGGVVVGVAFVLWTQVVVTVADHERAALVAFDEYRGMLDPGVHVVPPFVSETYPVDVRTRTVDVSEDGVRLQDDSPVTVDAQVTIAITDAEKAALEVDDPDRAVGNLARTTLRDVLGDESMEAVRHDREAVEARVRGELDDPTNDWGIRIESFELEAVDPVIFDSDAE